MSVEERVKELVKQRQSKATKKRKIARPRLSKPWTIKHPGYPVVIRSRQLSWKDVIIDRRSIKQRLIDGLKRLRRR